MPGAVTEPSPNPGRVEVSVVIAAYRGAATIAACLRSVLRATEGRRREIFVVESSGDETREIVSREFPEVTLIGSDARLTAGAARNRGFQAARGRLIFVTDQDCVVPPDWVDRLERHLEGSGVGAAGGSVGVSNPSNLSGMAVYFLEFFRHFPTSGRVTRNRNFLVGCNSAYAAAALERTRFPDRTLAEDVLLSHAIRRAGFDLVYDPTVEVRHWNRSGWVEFLAYNRKMGEAAADYHRVTRPWWSGVLLSVPLLAFAAPIVIVPSIGLRLLRSRWSYLLRFCVLWPMCVLGNQVWAGALRSAMARMPRRLHGS
jgi:GT2 family glycosyltransferase